MTLHTYNIRGMIYCECSRLFSYCCTYTDAVIERERQSAAVAAAAEFALVADQAKDQPQQHRLIAAAAGYISIYTDNIRFRSTHVWAQIHTFTHAPSYAHTQTSLFLVIDH